MASPGVGLKGRTVGTPLWLDFERLEANRQMRGCPVVGRLENNEQQNVRSTVKPRILVVDDQRLITITLKHLLADEGYETATANSGEEAVEVARVFTPDFVLSDVAMGRMNGVQAAQRILSFLPQCKVLFMSANVRCREDGTPNFEIVAKPFSFDDLLAKISYLLSTTADNAAA